MKKKASPSKSASTARDRRVSVAAGPGNQGGGLKDGPSETTAYPRVGDNPAFADFVRGEIGAGTGPNQGADVTDQAEAKKPALGRPPGTGKHQKAAKALNEFQAAGIDETIMASVFKGVFQAAAFALDEKAINLSDAEANAFARPACILWGYYMPNQVTPVQAAWSQLAMVTVGVMGARSAAISRGWSKRRTAGKVSGEARAGGPMPTPAVPQSEIPTPGKVKFTPDVETIKPDFRPKGKP